MTKFTGIIAGLATAVGVIVSVSATNQMQTIKDAVAGDKVAQKDDGDLLEKAKGMLSAPLDRENEALQRKLKPYVEGVQKLERQNEEDEVIKQNRAAEKADPLRQYRLASDGNGVVPLNLATCLVNKRDDGSKIKDAMIFDKVDGPVVSSTGTDIEISKGFCEVGGLKFKIEGQQSQEPLPQYKEPSFTPNMK